MPNNDRIADGRTTMRNMPDPKGIVGDTPFVYPIFDNYPTGEPE